jgi:hypothetical protein
VSNALLFDAAVKDQKVVIVDEFQYRLQMPKLAKKWGEGASLRGRIEPEEEAYTHGQLKHLWGHIYTPLQEWNGDFATEWHRLFKAAFLPEGKTSLTQLNRQELDDYIRQCETYAHTAHPEAFALMEPVGRRA